MANPTNPNRVVRVKDLNRFKGNTDGLYATKTALQNKSNINHNHDTRYYTEAEILEIITGGAK